MAWNAFQWQARDVLCNAWSLQPMSLEEKPLRQGHGHFSTAGGIPCTPSAPHSGVFPLPLLELQALFIALDASQKECSLRNAAA